MCKISMYACVLLALPLVFVFFLFLFIFFYFFCFLAENYCCRFSLLNLLLVSK